MKAAMILETVKLIFISVIVSVVAIIVFILMFKARGTSLGFIFILISGLTIVEAIVCWYHVYKLGGHKETIEL